MYLKHLPPIFLFCIFSITSFSQGNALEFDGINDYVTIGSPLLPISSANDPWTIEAWIKTTTSGHDVICSQYEQFTNNRMQISLNQSNLGKVNYWKFSSGEMLISSTNVNDNTWHHVAVVKEGSGSNQVHLYVDGVLEDSGTDGSPMINAVTEIGRVNNSAEQRNFPGSMDEIRFWNFALSASEIAAIYDDEFSNPSTASNCLIANYQFNQSGGNFATDGTANGNTATLINMDNSDWVPSSAGVTAQPAITCPSAVPIELLSFSGEIIEKQIRLEWSTLNEVNNEGFEIQKSKNGSDWGQTGFVNGKGHSNNLVEYEFWDKHPWFGINYYRLKQIDFDGQTSFSEVRSFNFINEGQIRVFPNPADESINVSGISEGKLSVFNSFGRLVNSQSIFTEVTKIDISNYSNGFYFLQINSINGQTIQKFFKN